MLRDEDAFLFRGEGRDEGGAGLEMMVRMRMMGGVVV